MINRTIEYIWVTALGILLAYEVFAIVTGRETLSKSIWNAERTIYGPALCLVVGILMAHFFFQTKVSLLAFIVGFVLGVFWFQF